MPDSLLDGVDGVVERRSAGVRPTVSTPSNHSAAGLPALDMICGQAARFGSGGRAAGVVELARRRRPSPPPPSIKAVEAC